ncbi:MAG: dihydrodipicolinate synthase family protein [Methanocella sp.]
MEEQTMKNKFQGIFAANTTPFEANGSLDAQALEKEVNFLVDAGINGFFAGGTYGEGPVMSPEEYGDYIKTFTNATRGRVAVIAQVGATSLAQAIEQAQAATAAKVDALAAIPPFYYPHDNRAVLEFYRDLSEATTLPIFVYNNPWRSGIKVSPALLGELIKIPRVVGMKDSSDSLQEFCKYQMAVGPEFHLMLGNDDLTLAGFVMGAPGAIIVLAALFPEIYVGLYKAFKSGDLAEARRLQMEAIKVRLVLKEGPYVSTYKAVLNLLGRRGGHPKKPLRMPTKEEMGRIEAGLRQLGYLK